MFSGFLSGHSVWINSYWCRPWFYFIDACIGLCLRFGCNQKIFYH
ncbi:hypothetical protein Pint_35239 [Pistacia integerrima]|uniref:Uncharacterized protein n=1 Tax=Pistacia integerrima TaxID=434235 RepID=A0ACC0Y348_9ROSI|nr:hypothetical protein Pint_35239 [Pistacia integerrima]